MKLKRYLEGLQSNTLVSVMAYGYSLAYIYVQDNFLYEKALTPELLNREVKSDYIDYDSVLKQDVKKVWVK